MRISVIAMAVLVSTGVAASPLIAQSTLVPHVPSHAAPATGGIGLVPGSVPHRGHRVDRRGGTSFGLASGKWRGNIGHDRRERDGHDGRDGRRGRHRGGYGGLIGYGGLVGYGDYFDSYATTVPAPDEFGFFANGGEAALVNGRAVYDYDRSYPYEYYHERRVEEAAADAASADRAVPSGCETIRVPDGRGGGIVPVRICRR